jgi:glycosyltransferase involved in cell wall biosynthesis
MKVVLATPTVERPHPAYVNSMDESVKALDAAGMDASMVLEIGNPYISCARAEMLRKALDARADVIVLIDHDLSWRPQDLVTLIQTNGDVIAGTYRFKEDAESYMGRCYPNRENTVISRPDGCVKMSCVPAGFLKVTPDAIDRFMTAYPNLVYGKKWHPYVDLFNHGAFGGLWFGEDYAFSRNWNDLGGEIWCIPDLDLTHHSSDKAFPGNFHQYLLRQPGASNDPERLAA